MPPFVQIRIIWVFIQNIFKNVLRGCLLVIPALNCHQNHIYKWNPRSVILPLRVHHLNIKYRWYSIAKQFQWKQSWKYLSYVKYRWFSSFKAKLKIDICLLSTNSEFSVLRLIFMRSRNKMNNHSQVAKCFYGSRNFRWASMHVQGNFILPVICIMHDKEELIWMFRMHV